ncbi:hypothetical protein G3M58_18585, partial [Streptomyces sp. SID7499]|nr:hypothetical protein [Streptomyces sp. SID7499]
GDFPEALSHNRSAHAIAGRMELRYEEAQALDGIAATREALGDPEAADDRLRAGSLFAAMGVPTAAFRSS